jgi:hypothetical protein
MHAGPKASATRTPRQGMSGKRDASKHRHVAVQLDTGHLSVRQLNRFFGCKSGGRKRHQQRRDGEKNSEVWTFHESVLGCEHVEHSTASGSEGRAQNRGPGIKCPPNTAPGGRCLGVRRARLSPGRWNPRGGRPLTDEGGHFICQCGQRAALRVRHCQVDGLSARLGPRWPGSARSQRAHVTSSRTRNERVLSNRWCTARSR